jgi:hypothetical protein
MFYDQVDDRVALVNQLVALRERNEQLTDQLSALTQQHAALQRAHAELEHTLIESGDSYRHQIYELKGLVRGALAPNSLLGRALAMGLDAAQADPPYLACTIEQLVWVQRLNAELIAKLDHSR